MTKMNKQGRPRIYSLLGQKRRHSVQCYDLEWQQIKILMEKLKRERPKYYLKEGENDETIKQRNSN